MANILITGASSGLGEALAYHYAKDPNNALFICGRNPVRLNNVAQKCKKLGAFVEEEIIDVTNQNSVKKWIEKCQNKFVLNLIIANAGVSTDEEESIDANYNTMNINVFGVMNTIFPAIEILKKQTYKNKQIVIISSIAGYFPMSQCPTYSASKSCVKSLGLALREKYKKQNIKINVVCPGFVRSRITDKNTCPMPLLMDAEVAAKKIAKRLERNQGLITFPFAYRILAGFIAALPYSISSFIINLLPKKR